MTLLVVAISASAKSYIPSTVKTISEDTLVILKDQSQWNDGWRVMAYEALAGNDTKPNPATWDSDFGTQPTSNVKHYQVKTDGGVFNSKKRVIHFLVTNVTGVKAVGNAGNNRGFQIGATEYVSGTTTESSSMTIVAGNTSAQNPVSYNSLDASKTYIISIFAYGGDVNLYAVYFTAAETKTISTQAYAGVKKGTATLTENTDYTVDGTTITLTAESVTAPTDIKLINHVTYTDESSEDKDVAVEFGETASEGYFEGSVTIGLTTYTVKAPEEVPASAPTITTDIEAAYNVQKGKTQELSIVAEDASSYQWYLNGSAVDGATSASYTYTAGSTIGVTDEVYCAATNAAGSTNSTVATMTVTGSNACQLLQVQYSNNFYAFITQPTAEPGRESDPYTITSYYLEGEDVPTIVSSGVTVSAGATWAVDGNTLTVTAEDEVTTAEFTINAPVAVSPYTGLGEYTFTAADTWVKTGYAFDTDTKKTGWKFAKNDESDGKLRNADGRTRIYLFVGPCKTIKLTSGCSSDRNIRVFRNGTEVLGSTTLGKNGGTVTFNGDEDNAAMYEVRSAQTGGDGSIKIMTVATTTEPITIPSDEVVTYVTKQALDFSTQNGAFKAYAVTNVGTTSATTAEVGQVPAGTPLLIKGAAGSYDVEVIASAEDIENLLLASDGTVAGGDNIYAYSKTLKKFKKVSSSITIPAGKCYLQATGGTTLDIDFEGEATAIGNVNANDNANFAPVKVLTAKGVQIGKFNVAGQQVK